MHLNYLPGAIKNCRILLDFRKVKGLKQTIEYFMRHVSLNQPGRIDFMSDTDADVSNAPTESGLENPSKINLIMLVFHILSSDTQFQHSLYLFSN